MGVDAVGHRMHQQVAEVAAVFQVDALQGVIRRVDHAEIVADLGQEVGHPQSQLTLGVLSNKHGHRSIPVYDLQHPVEELRCVNGFGSDPVHFLPVTHGIGVGGAVKGACAHEIVELVVHVRLSEGAAKLVGGLLRRSQALRQTGVQLGVVAVVVFELTPEEHEPVRRHEEFQLLVVGKADAPVHRLGQGGVLLVDEPQHPGAGGVELFHRRAHLLRSTCHRRDDHEGPRAHPPVAGGVVLGGVEGEHLHGAALLHVYRGLKAARPCPADAQPTQVVALTVRRVHDRLDLSSERQGAAHIVQKPFFLKFYHEYFSPLC